jgi:hypothetical protein
MKEKEARGVRQKDLRPFINRQDSNGTPVVRSCCHTIDHRSSLFNQTTINQNETFHYSYFHHSTLRRQCISVSVVVVANKAGKAQHSFETKRNTSLLHDSSKMHQDRNDLYYPLNSAALTSTLTFLSKQQ